jgi:hypothetical protein
LEFEEEPAMKRFEMPALAAALLAACSAETRPELLDEARILDLGKDAVPLLREAMASTDPAVSRRGLELMAKITGQWGSDGAGIAWKRSTAEAVEEATRSGKPILLLHIFGRLDEEFC